MAIYSGAMQNKEHPVLVMGEIGLVSSLGRVGLPVFVGTEIKHNIATHSRYVKQSFVFSSYDSPEFIDELYELGYYFKKKPVIFSDDDRAILNISRNRERLEEHYLFLLPDKSTVNSILDKKRFSALSEKHQLPLPASYEITTSDDFEKIASTITYPCIIKPTKRHYWWSNDFKEQMGFYKKAIKCDDAYHFKRTLKKVSNVNPNVVIQEYVEGHDKQHYSANLFVNEKGKLLGYYIAQKKRIYPIQAGTGTYIETVDNAEVLKISLEIIIKLKLRGLLNIQFKQDCRTGEYKLMEIHARNSLWSLLGAKAEANLAYIYYQNLVYGLEYKQALKARPNVKYFNLSSDIRALFDYRRQGEITINQWWKSLQGERVFAAISLSDPLPTLFKMWYILLRIKGKRPVKRIPRSEAEKDSLLSKNFNFLTRLF